MTDTPKGRATAAGKRADTNHGVYKLRAAIARRGIAALDQRTTLAKELSAWIDAIREDLGGGGNLTAAEETLVGIAAGHLALVWYIDDLLASQPEFLLDTEKRQLHRIVEQRSASAHHVMGVLDRLGLQRRAKDVKSWADIARESKGEGAGNVVSMGLPS